MCKSRFASRHGGDTTFKRSERRPFALYSLETTTNFHGPESLADINGQVEMIILFYAFFDDFIYIIILPHLHSIPTLKRWHVTYCCIVTIFLEKFKQYSHAGNFLTRICFFKLFTNHKCLKFLQTASFFFITYMSGFPVTLNVQAYRRGL